MKQYTATANDDGVRLSRFVQSVTRDLPTSLLYKSFRNKRIKVNGKRVTIPSYRCREGDVVEVRDRIKDAGVVLEAVQSPERDVPDFIETDHSKMTARFIRIPNLSDVPFPVQMEPHLIVEFYSR